MLSQINFWSFLPKQPKENKSCEIKKVDDDNKEIENLNQNNDEGNISSSEKPSLWGNYILEVGKSATNMAAKHVTSTAKQIRQNMSDITVMDQSNIISKFSDEQIKFKEEKRQFEKKSRETCLPWIDALNEIEGDEHVLKAKILSISSDERNFLRNPPPGSDFEFNYDLQSPVALLMLKEDTNLASMRYKLVPKRIKEDSFWRNYFYRVFLIKQSLQGDFKLKEDSSEDYNKGEKNNKEMNQGRTERIKSEDSTTKTNLEGGGRNENEDWEAELQKELSEFELINDDKSVSGTMDAEEDKGDYDDIEREILNELEK